MAETFCDSGAVKLKAGTNVSTSITAAQYTQLINQAESMINVEAKIPNFNLVDEYAALNSDVKLILEDAASSYAAISAVGFDPTGYSSIGEAAFIANLNWSKYLEAVKKVRDKQYTDFIRNQ